MSELRSTGLIDASPPTVGGALRHVDTAERALAAAGVRMRSTATRQLVPGEDVAFRLARLPASIRTRVVRADAEAFRSVLVGGPLVRLRHDSTLTREGSRTRLTDSLSWTAPLGRLGGFAGALWGRRLARDVLAHRLAAVRELAEVWAGLPVVVGAAIVHRGRLLVQQRRYPASDAGRWELPGGRVEPGEREADAVVRECREELAVGVVPTGRVGTDVPLDNGMLLRIHAAELIDPAAMPRAVEHSAVGWVDAFELTGLDWLDTDRVLAHSLRSLLARD